MNRHRSFPHELARASLDSAIAAGSVAHHSGGADDHYRRSANRIRQLSGAATSVSPCQVELFDTSDGRVRAVVDSDAGIWDSIIPAAVAARIRERAPWSG